MLRGHSNNTLLFSPLFRPPPHVTFFLTFTSEITNKNCCVTILPAPPPSPLKCHVLFEWPLSTDNDIICFITAILNLGYASPPGVRKQFTGRGWGADSCKLKIFFILIWGIVKSYKPTEQTKQVPQCLYFSKQSFKLTYIWVVTMRMGFLMAAEGEKNLSMSPSSVIIWTRNWKSAFS